MKLSGHAIEGGHQDAQLVRGGAVDLYAQVALRHFVGSFSQGLDGLGDLSRQEESDPDRREENQQGDHPQHQHEVGPDHLALLLHLLVIPTEAGQLAGEAHHFHRGKGPDNQASRLISSPGQQQGLLLPVRRGAPLPGDGPHRVDQGLGEIPPCRLLDNGFQGANHLREAGIGGEIGPAVPVGQQRASGPIEDDREINLQLAGDAFQLLNAVRTGSGPQALDVRVPGQESCGEHRSLRGILLHLPGDFAHAHGFEGLVQGRAEPLVQVSVHHGIGEEGHEHARKQGHPQEGKQELPVKARARPLALVLEVELQQVAQQNQDKGQQQDDVERSESPQKQGCLAPGIAENGREVEGLLHHREQQ